MTLSAILALTSLCQIFTWVLIEKNALVYYVTYHLQHINFHCNVLYLFVYNKLKVVVRQISAGFLTATIPIHKNIQYWALFIPVSFVAERLVFELDASKVWISLLYDGRSFRATSESVLIWGNHCIRNIKT